MYKYDKIEKLACSLIRWQAKLKNWHGVWHAGTFLACWHVKMRSLHAFGTLSRWHVHSVHPPLCWGD